MATTLVMDDDETIIVTPHIPVAAPVKVKVEKATIDELLEESSIEPPHDPKPVRPKPTGWISTTRVETATAGKTKPPVRHPPLARGEERVEANRVSAHHEVIDVAKLRKELRDLKTELEAVKAEKHAAVCALEASEKAIQDMRNECKVANFTAAQNRGESMYWKNRYYALIYSQHPVEAEHIDDPLVWG